MLQVIGLDSCDPLPVVLDLGPGLDQRVEHNVAVEVHDRDTSKPVTLLGQDALTVQCQNFRFSIVISVKICAKLDFKLL